MKKIIMYCFLWIVNLLVLPFKIKENKITFVSYEDDKLAKDFKMIAEKLQDDKDYELKYVLMKYKFSLLGMLEYVLNCAKQLYHINTSKVVLLDYNNFVVCNFKRKGVKVIQIWHASGAVKKFGNEVKRDYSIENYDYILSTSEVWSEIYSKAFNVEPEKVIPLGIPRTDRLLSEKKVEKYKKYCLEEFPQIDGKKVIVYAPTFRGNPLYKIQYQDIDLKEIREKLGDDYVIIYKLHPWFGDKVIADDKNIINGNNYNITKLFAAADYLISDYSAIIYDYTILERPMIFFVPDLEEYKHQRGLNFNYEEEMPGPICKSEDEVVKAIKENDFNIENIKKFKSKYFKYTDGKSCDRVVDFIKEIAKS